MGKKKIFCWQGLPYQCDFVIYTFNYLYSLQNFCFLWLDYLALHLWLEFSQSWEHFYVMPTVSFFSALSISRQNEEIWHTLGLEYSMLSLVILFQHRDKDHTLLFLSSDGCKRFSIWSWSATVCPQTIRHAAQCVKKNPRFNKHSGLDLKTQKATEEGNIQQQLPSLITLAFCKILAYGCAHGSWAGEPHTPHN